MPADLQQLLDDLADLLLLYDRGAVPSTSPAASPAAAAPSAEQAPYIEALQRIRQASGSFVLAPDSVLLLRQALFRTDISLPANLVEGPSRVRIFLTRGGEVVDMQESQIDVQKAGLERTLYRLAMEQPLIYGLLSLLMAMVAGWGAQELFKRLRI